MEEKPFRWAGVLLLLTHVVATVLVFNVAAVPSWIGRGVIIAIGIRMCVVREADNSTRQEAIMVCCFLVAAVDLFWAWAWLDVSIEDDSMSGAWMFAFPQLIAGFASIYAAKLHIPSKISDDRRRFTGFLMLVTHAGCFFFGGYFFPGLQWLIYLAGVLISVRLLVTKVEDVNLFLGVSTIVACVILAAADLWMISWCLTPEDDDSPKKWVMLFPTLAAALASIYTAGTLIQDRRLLAGLLITV